MINNSDPNNLVPLQSRAPLTPSIETNKTEGKGVASPSSEKVSALTFPERSSLDSDKKGNFNPRKNLINDSLIRELERVLRTQAEQIEMDFQKLESQEIEKELVETLLGVEGWGYGILGFTNEGVKSGVEFLENVLPHSLVTNMPYAKQWEELGVIASLGATLLTALDTGAQGVAIICKHKILGQSKEFLKAFKANFSKQIASEQAALTPGELKEVVLATPKNKKIQKAIDEWELQIAIEEKELREEKFQFGLNATTQTLTLIHEPLSLIPKELLLQQLSIVNEGLSWTLAGIEIFVASIELKHERKNIKALDKWMETYQKWQDDHLPKFEITENGAKRIGFTPHQPVILTPDEYEKKLIASIKGNPFSYGRIKLKECGIDLPSTITKKRELLSYLMSNPTLISKYVEFQKKLEKLNVIIYTSENLLTKRNAIIDKKVLYLESRYSSIEPQIRDRKKQNFSADIERVKEALQNPQCTPSQVEERLSKWGFLNPSLSTSNQELMLAFASFENSKVQERTDIINAKKHLLDELNGWKNQTEAIDKHFERWFSLGISEQEKQEFAADLQRLSEILQNPYSTFQQVEDLLIKWKIPNPDMLIQNPNLITAFVNLKKTMVKTSLSVSHQNLLDKVNEWTNQTNAIDQHFEAWFESQDKDSLIRDYIDHQETIEQTTKNAIKQMVQQKHELENHFQTFKFAKSSALFAVAVLSITVSIVLGILGLIGLPFGGAGAILLGLSIGSALVSVGFLAAGYLQTEYYKPETTKELGIRFSLKMAWTKMRSAISTYSHQAKEKKLIEVAKVLQKLHQTPKLAERSTNLEYQKALADYQKVKLDFEESQKQVDGWTKRLKKFERKLNDVGWKDFAQYANLQVGNQEAAFDTLNAFKAAFEACDLRLLSLETRELLQMQLGINLDSLQEQMKKDPEGIKKSLQEFFALGDAALISFIKNQRARMKKGLLKPLIA